MRRGAYGGGPTVEVVLMAQGAVAIVGLADSEGVNIRLSTPLADSKLVGRFSMLLADPGSRWQILERCWHICLRLIFLPSKVGLVAEIDVTDVRV
jgi:hypothetical protein